jgi:hypothetical protein
VRAELRVVCARHHGVLALVGRDDDLLVVRSRLLHRRASAPLGPWQFMACRDCRMVYHVSADQILEAIEHGDDVLRLPVSSTAVLG